MVAQVGAGLMPRLRPAAPARQGHDVLAAHGIGKTAGHHECICASRGWAVAPPAVKVVQTRLRHASATTTLNTYGHMFPDQDEATRTAVDAVLVARADNLRTSRSSA